MKKLYQLIARGSMARMSGSNKISSRKVWSTKQKAEDYIKEFRQLVTTPLNEYEWATLEDSELLNIGIVELELGA